jgi:hypothetical protein
MIQQQPGCQPDVVMFRNVKDIKTKAERSFDLGSFMMSKRNEPAFFKELVKIKGKQPCLFYTLERSKRSKFCLFDKFERSKRSELCLFHKLERSKRSEVCLFHLFQSNVKDIKTKAEHSFDLGLFTMSKRNEPAYSRTCKDQSEANPAYSTP